MLFRLTFIFFLSFFFLTIALLQGTAYLDWVYVDNVADAHVLALAAMMKDASKIAGQAYFIGSSFGPEDMPKYTYAQFLGAGNPKAALDHWLVRPGLLHDAFLTLYIEQEPTPTATHPIRSCIHTCCDQRTALQVLWRYVR